MASFKDFSRSKDVKDRARAAIKAVMPDAEFGVDLNVKVEDIAASMAAFVIASSSLICAITKDPDRRREGAALVSSQIAEAVEDAIIKDAMP